MVFVYCHIIKYDGMIKHSLARACARACVRVCVGVSSFVFIYHVNALLCIFTSCLVGDLGIDQRFSKGRKLIFFIILYYTVKTKMMVTKRWRTFAISSLIIIYPCICIISSAWCFLTFLFLIQLSFSKLTVGDVSRSGIRGFPILLSWSGKKLSKSFSFRKHDG